MNIASRPAPVPLFNAVEVTIRIESLHEMAALEAMCRPPHPSHFAQHPTIARFFEELKPHVTVL